MIPMPEQGTSQTILSNLPSFNLQIPLFKDPCLVSVLNTLSLSVRDYYLKNANGRNKILSGNSRIEYISNKQLRWILVDNAHESLSFSANSTYPSGISLPADIILTKVESLNPHRLKFHIVPDMFERDDYTIDQNGNPQVITDPELLNGFSIPENMILEKIK